MLAARLAVVAQCSAQQFDCLDWSKNFGTGAHNAFGEYVRGNELGFRLLGVRKVDALLSILSKPHLAFRESAIGFTPALVFARSPFAKIAPWETI